MTRPPATGDLRGGGGDAMRRIELELTRKATLHTIPSFGGLYLRASDGSMWLVTVTPAGVLDVVPA